MKTPAIGTFAFGFVGVAAIVLIAIGAPSKRVAATPPAASDTPAPSSVSGGGFTLTSTTVDLPLDDTGYPDGPHADVINANCTACHSASMALNQPALTQDQWSGEVNKMAETYKAPIDKQDMPAIVEYLTAMSAKLPGTAAPAAQNGSAGSGHASEATAG